MATLNLSPRCMAEQWLLYFIAANSPNSQRGLRKNRKDRRVSLEQIVIHAIHGAMAHNYKDEAAARFTCHRGTGDIVDMIDSRPTVTA